jgi:deoxyadenosine kinase
MFVGVSGLIGAGKSTLTRQLSEEMGRRGSLRQAERQTFMGHTPPVFGPQWKAVYEPVETNPYLEDFYEDISRWTFNMQMFLLAKRFQQHQEVIWDPCHRPSAMCSEPGGVIQDRTIYEDTIFARMHRDDGLMDDRDWETYITHFHVMQGFLRYPDVILYLRVEPEVAAARIKERGRNAEKEIPIEYLQRLHEGYEEFVEEMKRYTVVVPFDWTEYKPVAEVADAVEAATAQEQKFLRSLRRI